MSDLTVRSVATFLREPWWISIETSLLEGREKQTARCERSFVNLPALSTFQQVPQGLFISQTTDGDMVG